MPATIRERADAGGDGRTIEVRIMPWGTVADTEDGREMFERGAFAGVDPTRVTIESQRHGGTLVGRGTAIEEREDAAYLRGRISETPAGDELLTLVKDGVVSEASVSFKSTRTARRKGVLVRQAVDLWRVAILERGAFPGAGVVAVRSKLEGPKVTDENGLEGLPPPANDADRIIAAMVAPLQAKVEGLDTKVIELASRSAVPPPLNRPSGWESDSVGDLLYRSLEEPHERREPNAPSDYARAIAAASQTLRERAFADQITANNVGLIPPAHLTEAAGLVSAGRPTIEAFGVRSMPATGMDIDWPSLVPLAGRAIATQPAQKTEIVTRRVDFERKTAPIVTYAGGSDLALQLIRRSSPAYRELYARVMLMEYARVTDDAFADMLIALAGTQTIDYDPAADTDGKVFRAALFAASVKVQRATGSPASLAVVSEDLFIKLGSSTTVVDPGAGPSNATGTSSARDLSLSISGLSITLGNVDMPAGTAIVSNRIAGSWYEDGPFSIEAPDVPRLGVNVAYWGLGAGVFPVPAGIVKVYNAP